MQTRPGKDPEPAVVHEPRFGPSLHQDGKLQTSANSTWRGCRQGRSASSSSTGSVIHQPQGCSELQVQALPELGSRGSSQG